MVWRGRTSVETGRRVEPVKIGAWVCDVWTVTDPSSTGVIKSGCGLSSWNWGQECPQNPQAGKAALRVAQTFLSAGSGDFPVARPSPTLNHTRGPQGNELKVA